MNLINPRLTVQNAEGSQWLLTFEHAWNQAVTKAVELLQLLKRQPE